MDWHFIPSWAKPRQNTNYLFTSYYSGVPKGTIYFLTPQEHSSVVICYESVVQYR